MAMERPMKIGRVALGICVFLALGRTVTPTVRLIPSYQHIWHPLAAQAAKSQDHSDLFLTRLTVAW